MEIGEKAVISTFENSKFLNEKTSSEENIPESEERQNNDIEVEHLGFDYQVQISEHDKFIEPRKEKETSINGCKCKDCCTVRRSIELEEKYSFEVDSLDVESTHNEKKIIKAGLIRKLKQRRKVIKDGNLSMMLENQIIRNQVNLSREEGGNLE